MNLPVRSAPASERLRFRLPSPNDAAFYLKLMSDPDYIRFIADHGIRTEDDAAQYITTKSLTRFSEHGVGLWVVELKDPGEPVGVCGLVVRKELKYPDLGYAFLDEFRGLGIGREAAKAVLTFAWRDLNLQTLCAITSPDNTRSASLLTKIGFEASGQRHLAEIDATADYYILKQGNAEAGKA